MPDDVMHAHDPKIEAAFLGSVITDPDILAEGWSVLPDEVFYAENHRQVWREIKRQNARDGVFDMTTLASTFFEAGGAQDFMRFAGELAELWTSAYPPYSWLAYGYAQRMKRLYAKREATRAARKYESDIAQGVEPAEAQLEFDMITSAIRKFTDDDAEVDDEDLARSMGPEGRYPTGFTNLDRTTGGFANPGLILVAARPSVGKSSFARSVIRGATRRGHRVFWYSQDQSENQILELEITRAYRTTPEKLREMSHEDRLAAIRHVRQEVWRDRVHLVDRPLPLNEILSVAKIDPPDLMVVDYIQIIQTGDDEEYDRISRVSMALKTLAFQLRCPILALAQFNRKHQPGTTPSMANLRGSGQLEQDAEQIYALERDTTEGSNVEQHAKLHILKNKTGPTGLVSLHWRGKYATYENAEALT